MSKAVPFMMIAVVASLIGFFSSRLVNHAELKGDGNAVALLEKNDPKKPELHLVKKPVVTIREFLIDGMMCQGCADGIATALDQLPGVQSTKVSFAEKRAIVVADESELPTEKIMAAISAAGYQARLPSAAPSKPAASKSARVAPAFPVLATASMSGNQAQAFVERKVTFSSAPPAPAKQPVVINITHGKGQLHSVSMGLRIAQLAVKEGRKTVVLLNVEAPVFAAKDLDPDDKFADFPPIKQMLADFIAAGGQVLVCEHCAKIAELKPEDLIDGAKLVGHGEIFSILPRDAVVFSY